MFTLPQNTIAYLLKEPIDMRYGMFRLQGVIAQLMQQPMPRGASRVAEVLMEGRRGSVFCCWFW